MLPWCVGFRATATHGCLISQGTFLTYQKKSHKWTISNSSDFITTHFYFWFAMILNAKCLYSYLIRKQYWLLEERKHWLYSISLGPEKQWNSDAIYNYHQKLSDGTTQNFLEERQPKVEGHVPQHVYRKHFLAFKIYPSVLSSPIWQ